MQDFYNLFPGYHRYSPRKNISKNNGKPLTSSLAKNYTGENHTLCKAVNTHGVSPMTSMR